MAEIEFQNWQFKRKKETISIIFATKFRSEIDINDFLDIDKDIIVEKNKLIFPNISEKKAENKLNRILEKAIHNLTHLLNGKKILYLDQNSNIPLIGSGEFGIIDRNTSLLELKPSTGCNLNCIYCSVDEGENNKISDILIDPEYLVEETRKLANTKNHPVEINIGPHGEPFVYPFMIELIEGLRSIEKVNVISINTNGTYLTNDLIDELSKYNPIRLNVSINTMDQEKSSKLSGRFYPIEEIKKVLMYAKDKVHILIAPLIIPTFNDNLEDVEELIKFSLSIRGKVNNEFPPIGFQNFLEYKGGRNPVKSMPWEKFFDLLKPFEEKYNLVLTPKAEYNPFKIFEDKTLEKPMKKNETVKVSIITQGRDKREKICTANNRIVMVRNLDKDKGEAKVKIIRDKHNIFLASKG